MQPDLKRVQRALASADVTSRARLPCHCVPFSKNPGFVGREDELQETYKHLNDGSKEMRTVSFHGHGGVGKTQMCLEYIFRHDGEYTAIFWVSADTVPKMAQDIRHALVKLGLIGDGSDQSEQQCRTLFTTWLRETGKELYYVKSAAF